MAHPDLPRPSATTLRKTDLLAQLDLIDGQEPCRNRILQMETNFRETMGNHVTSLPTSQSKFQKFNTNPFVLMIHSLKRGYSKISQIEDDILPAKEFSSMETSAGRMAEAITLPIYGWECVASQMHTSNSALDGKRAEPDTLKLVTLKSGPRCLNDEMSENFADAIINNVTDWATGTSATKVEFSYGVLYGTKKLSNKKDWHILRNLMDKLPTDSFSILPTKRWNCRFEKDGIDVSVDVRIGVDWWTYLGGQHCLLELFVALIRACVMPGEVDGENYDYKMSDLGEIIDTSCVAKDFNVSLLQQSQIPWLFFLAKHFYDNLVD